MKILAVADVEESVLFGGGASESLEGVEAILSCGDLAPAYLEYLVSVLNVPLLYVRGNHDGIYDTQPPGGGTCIDGEIARLGNFRILGLGGCMRFREGKDVYSEAEMRQRIRKLGFQIRRAKGFDILMTHAPAKGYGDLEDLPHTGFECFNTLLVKWRPKWMLHAHVHTSYGRIVRERAHECGTGIINVSGYRILDL